MITYTLLSVYALWIFYLAVMSLLSAKEKGTLSKTAIVFGCPVLIIGVLINVLLNATLFTIVFLKLPQDWTFSKRLARYIKGEKGWRYKLASFICKDLLDAFDPDHRGHCR